MTREAIISKALATLDACARPVSVAQIGGFRPPATCLTSWFGGQFVGMPGETWPSSVDGQMLTVLQVRTDELPYRPQALASVALFNVFAGPKRLPTEFPARNGDRWLIRCYASLAELQPLTGNPASSVREFPIRWVSGPAEGPVWENNPFDDDLLRAFAALPESIDLFYDHSTRHHLTKIGGWPSYIQGTPTTEGNFIFQIGSEEKPHWMWGDNGTAYFYEKNGEWSMGWDCY